MTQKFLESDKVDSKIFQGRVLSLLGEILQNQNSMRIYLEDAFHVPGTNRRYDSDEEEVQSYDTEEEDE